MLSYHNRGIEALIIKPNSIHNMDCIEGMKFIKSGTVDLLVTDPPFAISFKAKKANYNRTASLVLEGYKDKSVKDYLRFSAEWMQEAFRILKPSGAMFVFSGWNNLGDILNALHVVGFKITNQIPWKYQFGVNTRRCFVSSHYTIMYVCKNDKLRKFYPNCRFADNEKDSKGRSLRYQDMEDVWTIPREYWTGKEKTPTKLPSEIIRKILAYTSQPNDVICDPFIGSGQVAKVAKEMKRKYIGFEIESNYYNFALQHIAGKKTEYLVIFYNEKKTVLTESYDNKQKAQERIKNYKGGCQVRLEEKP